jgi:hypothetical protein
MNTWYRKNKITQLKQPLHWASTENVEREGQHHNDYKKSVKSKKKWSLERLSVMKYENGEPNKM